MKHQDIIKHTKSLIRHNLCQLILAKDYDEITVKEICDKAQISRMSFYRLYNNKDDVLIEYTDERFEEFFGIVKSITNINAHVFLLEALNYVYKYRTSISYLIRAHREFLLLEQFNSYAKYLNAKYSSNGIFEFTIDKLNLLTGGFLNFIINWLNNEPETPPEAMHERLMNIINKPLFFNN